MPVQPKPKRKTPSVHEQRVAFCVMGLLVIIATAMGVLQGRFNPLAWREQPGALQPGRTADSNPAADKATGLAAISPPEQYDAGTLSDKINGKAELYLSAGFKGLESRRFALADDVVRWMERYVYTMDGHRNAFAVFSSQRRQQIVALDVAAHAYMASNGLFFVHGPYYVEIISAENSSSMQAAMKTLAEAFIDARPIQSDPLAALALFPSDHRVPHSVALMADSAFGIEALDWVYTAAYADGEMQAVAFVVPCGSVGKAAELAAAFNGYWMEFGGEKMDPPAVLKDAVLISILDTYEIAMVQGRYLFGVHEATHLDFGVALAEGLRQTIGDYGP